MAKKRRTPYRGQPPARQRWRPSLRAGLVAFVALAAIAIIGYAALAAGGTAIGRATPWATLGTPDVHALAFDPADAQHLYFGHHNGLLESDDGGRTWSATELERVDAMNVETAGDDVLQVAGHDVYIESTDGGQTWQPVPNDLPGLDLHAFVTDPADNSRAWAFAAGFGLFGTTDRGRHWEALSPGSWVALTAYRSNDATVLVAVSQDGLVSSADGGRTWQALADPGGQVASLAAAADGSVLYAGTSSGLMRSTDAGKTWQPTAFDGTPVAVAVAAADPETVAVVDDETRYFRSDDGGATWPGPG